MAVTAKSTESPAEQKFGYQFGIEGLMTLKQAAAHLSVSRTTLFDLVDKGRIRVGRSPGEAQQRRYRFCKRSILDYCKSLET